MKPNILANLTSESPNARPDYDYFPHSRDDLKENLNFVVVLAESARSAAFFSLQPDFRLMQDNLKQLFIAKIPGLYHTITNKALSPTVTSGRLLL